MNATAFLLTARRRWYIVALGLAATFACVHLSQPETVYWAEVTLTVEGPLDPVTPKTLEDRGNDPVAAATLLVRLVNGGRTEPRSTSPDATLYGEGKRAAVAARLRDTGSQWVSDVKEPVVMLQAVDFQRQAVMARLAEHKAALDQLLVGLQDDLQVVPSQRMVLSQLPTAPSVLQVTGSRFRAYASTTLLGFLATLAALYWTDVLLRRRPLSSTRQRSFSPSSPSRAEAAPRL